jgi:hypothetical protein
LSTFKVNNKMHPSSTTLPLTTILLTVLLVLLTTLISAHTKLFYFPGRLTIRNADNELADGHFSVAGACGGSDRWGNKDPTYVVNGQKICTRFQFNGGHKMIQNKIRAVFGCGTPNQGPPNQQQQIRDFPPIAFVDGTDPPPAVGGMQIDAYTTNEVWEGYVVCVKITQQNFTDGNGNNLNVPINDVRRFCTLSILDQRNWGGCHDLIIMDEGTINPVVALPKLTPDQLSTAVVHMPEAEATYKIADCDGSSGGKCCLEGYIAIRSDGAVSARLRGTTAICNDVYTYGWHDFQSFLRPSPFSLNQSRTNIYFDMGWDQFGILLPRQNISLQVFQSPTGAVLTLSNIGLDIPYIADHNAVRYTSLDQGVGLALVPYPTGVDGIVAWYVIVGVVGGLLLIYLVGGCIISKYTGGPCHHPHIHFILVECGCVKRKARKVVEDGGAPFKGFNPKLPANWSSAVDSSTGEVYYFNSLTKEVTWTRPTEGGDTTTTTTTTTAGNTNNTSVKA